MFDNVHSGIKYFVEAWPLTLYVMEVESILENIPHHLLPGLLGVVHKHGTIDHQV